MRRILVPIIAVVALLGVVSVASADTSENGYSNVWFFGDCGDIRMLDSGQSSADQTNGWGCRGFALFLGDWDAESMANEIAYEAYDDFGGEWVTTKLLAFDLAHGGQPAIGSEYECYYNNVESTEATQSIWDDGQVGLWIAWFSVEPCYTDN